MLLAGLAVLLALAGGTALCGWAEREWGLATRVAAGVPVGLTLLALVGYALASALGFSAATVVGAALLVALPLFGLLRPSWRAAWRLPPRVPARWPWLEPAAFGLGALALLTVFQRALLVSPAGWGTGDAHNFGDLPFHLGVIQGFVLGENFPPEHPELCGARLTYPFLADFGVAQLVRAGLELPDALRLQNALLALALLVLAQRFSRAFSADRLAALLAPALLLLNGGLGFLLLLADSRASGLGLGALLQQLPHDYTIVPGGELRFGNLITTLLIPQRGLLLGLPLALIVWTLLWRACTETEGVRRRLVAAGCVTALMPLAHSHTFAVALCVAVALAVLMDVPPRAWAGFLLPALLLGVPQGLWLASGTSLQAGRFLGFELGWDRGAQNPLWFWLTNAGLFLPLLLTALLRPGLLEPRQRRFYLPFACCFVLPNLLRLSPWMWDNIKFLVHWYAVSVPLVALLLARLWRAGRWRAGLAVLAAAVLVAAGALDVWRVGSRQIDYRLFDLEGLVFAQQVAAHTPASARIVASPVHDSPVLLAGRRLLLGYPGHIWSQGLDSGTREQDIARIYSGAPEAPELLARYQVQFVVVGPEEVRQQALSAGLFQQMPLVAASGRYALYDARPLWPR